MADVSDPEGIRRYYDALGEGEWDRLSAEPADEVKAHVHAYYLREFVHAGDHVLDIGAGPGRFTIELARLGASVTVADISPAHLDLKKVLRRRAVLARLNDVQRRARPLEGEGLRDARHGVAHGGAVHDLKFR
ncbi:MAG: methyltransferase domain-containing protein [Candidatus Poribacteria bacterium]